MNKQLFLLVLLFFTTGILCTFGQARFLEDINGRPILEKNYTAVEGSPYLLDEWAEGVVKLIRWKPLSGLGNLTLRRRQES